MTHQLYIGAVDTHIFVKKRQLTVHKGQRYVFEPGDIKGHEWAFRTVDQEIDHLLRRVPVEQATAAPGELREVTKPKRPPAKKPATARKKPTPAK